MKKLVLISLILMLGLFINLKAQDVPPTVSYCDIEIKLSPDAQTRIKEYYRQIVASPRYFNEMVKRAQLYMPFIDEAFAQYDIPEDLKYLAIQESALRADVVSSSKAVGFWQLKDGTASDLNLQIDGDVDERMHIFRASQAAAKYLNEANKGYANWVYALLSYYEGPTGSVPYTNPDYYGETSMHISANDHWYILKAIANKLAYKEALSSNERPELYLMPFVAKAGTSIKELLQKHNIEEEEFLRYNKWIRNSKRISRKKDYTYYIVRTGSSYIGHIPDPLKVEEEGKMSDRKVLAAAPPVGDLKALEKEDKPEPRMVFADEQRVKEEKPIQTSTQSISQPNPVNANIFAPKAIDIHAQMSGDFVEFQLRHDLDYGIEFLEYTGYTRVAEIADRYKKGLAAFLLYNGLVPGNEPEKGSIIYIERPERRSYHIVESGESLTDIAADHLTSVARIQNRNRMSASNFTIYVGQKLYLKDRKPKEEKIIILSAEIEELEAIAETESEKPQEEENLSAEVETPIAIKEEVEEQKIEEVSPPPTLEVEEKSEENAAEEMVNNTEEAMEFFNPESQEFKPVWVQHIVAEGETLWQISQKYGTQVDLIKKINKLETDAIIMGQYLRVLATKKF
ncbi:MAG: LysM peptidoglycan-binding domain-containing protein [Bacteroidia bacterium]|nr:LysM peptidoglycan-binding domain-containing protein [Bacteroidia bacterium]